MTAFDNKNKSRDGAAPVNLFVFSGADQKKDQLENLIESVTLIPGTTEFGYGTTVIRKTLLEAENAIAGGDETDFVRSTRQLMERAPNLRHVSLVVAWHGDDLRVGQCEIKPRVDRADKATSPYEWSVGPVIRSTAEVVTYIDGKPAAGGAPADRSVYEAVQHLKSLGLKVTLYPFILMDVPSDNSLPNPYGGASQPAYPWRGRITCDPSPESAGTVDKTATAATQVAAFFGTVDRNDFGWNASEKRITYSGPANEWSFRRHILHIARIAAEAGADDFLIGTEMVGLTSIRGAQVSGKDTYPGVDQLISLLAEVRATLGASVDISYAADWSEYHSHRPWYDAGVVNFHLDPLWSHPDIDYIGIDNYLPLTDWRVGDDHLDRQEGHVTLYDRPYMRSRVEGGELFDWYYVSETDRDNQVRTPIADGSGQPWVYRQKDIRSWWSNGHENRTGYAPNGDTTGWIPKSKPVVFTELGCAAANRASNQPNVFVDPKSSESFYPRYSLGVRDDLVQRLFLESTITHWRDTNETSPVYGGDMIDLGRLSIWAWDARPYPEFPYRGDFWGDAPNWEVGHWLNGRIRIPDEDFGTTSVYRFTDHVRPVVYDGETYDPVPIKPGKSTMDGKLTEATLELRVSRDNELGQLFSVYRPAHPIELRILQGHLTTDPLVFVPKWNGTVRASKRAGGILSLTGTPHSAALGRTGLRRNYQLGCPHMLYGPKCKADRASATDAATVQSVDGSKVTLQSGGAWEARDVSKFTGGVMQWTTPGGTIERRRVLGVKDSNVFHLSGAARDLQAGGAIAVSLGCGHSVFDCRDLHNNLANYGGCPSIPTKNPLSSSSNNFY